ncbi:hypothetical protein PBI_HUFFY_34 [Gordonia phage Huffy]|uniref:Uncharacterized protein n=1 Tax=Gordonia phage TZGordon TaxID=2744004 RepID=A0A6N0A581_9CAUD|nr:hypothetical protein KDJ61_gp81 [Gordonia phage TZGordon]AQY55636.1 hypothetical protein PBI_HUFFY_34 [Gordonia phage Huffy]AQY55718.1 hypothetical protein PBI_DINODARYN_34 [Gordonia phage DinoDaryn]QKO02955.1 hypothetical protein SEA_TZGORDON_35 [Gordonia phage TZGordon]
MRGTRAQIVSGIVGIAAVALFIAGGRYVLAGVFVALWLALFAVWLIQGRRAGQ